MKLKESPNNINKRAEQQHQPPNQFELENKSKSIV